MSVARFARFACVGAVATALQYAVLVALVEFAALPATVASTVGFACGAVANYLLNRAWTFGARGSHARAAPRFAAMAAAGLALNAAVMAALHDLATLPYLLAQVLATGACLWFNYRVASRWVYATASLAPPTGARR